jgi:pimeloyl-ACP methyl ester carboxylesterase
MLGLAIIAALLAVCSGECADVFPHALDVGYYWARAAGDGVAWTKSCVGDVAAAFDPGRESIVFVHGLQPGGVVARHRFFIDDPDATDAVLAHLGLGRNVGVFQWIQLADEPITNFIRAEGKLDAIDFVDGTRYVYIDEAGRPQTADGPLVSVSETAYQHYLAHWTGGAGQPRVHLIGHSLGAQLVVYLAQKVVAGGRARVDRVTMLDPVYSDSAKPYLARNLCGVDIASVLGCYLGLLRDAGVAVDLYRASFINRCIFSSENNAQMINNSAAVSLTFAEWGDARDGYCWNEHLMTHMTVHNLKGLGRQISNQHAAVVTWYVRSGLSKPPAVCMRKGAACERTRTSAVSGAMSDADVLRWAGRGECMYQYANAGTKNADPVDDLFYLADCANFNT